MDSEKNRRALSAGLGRYVLAMPAGRLREVQEDVLSRPGRYRRVSASLEAKEVVVGDGEARRCYVACRNLKEAERQRLHREEVLAQLRAELARIAEGSSDHPTRACELAASRRFGRYLSKGRDGTLRIDAALHALVKAGRVHHAGNQTMTWCVANTAVKEDENVRPVKSSPKKRIDGVVAAVTALSRLMVLPERPASPYAYRGVRSVG